MAALRFNITSRHKTHATRFWIGLCRWCYVFLFCVCLFWPVPVNPSVSTERSRVTKWILFIATRTGSACRGRNGILMGVLRCALKLPPLPRSSRVVWGRTMNKFYAKIYTRYLLFNIQRQSRNDISRRRTCFEKVIFRNMEITPTFESGSWWVIRSSIWDAFHFLSEVCF